MSAVPEGDSGWYPDPGHASVRMRFWDGSDWTEHTRARPGITVADAYSASVALLTTSSENGEHDVLDGTLPDQFGTTSYEDLPVSNAQLRYYVARERAMRTANPWAYAGLTIGLVGLAFDPVGLTSLLSVLFALIGIPVAMRQHRNGLRYSGRVTTLIALAVGIAGVFEYVAVAAMLSHHTAHLLGIAV